jgi:hypothetical protein
LNETEHEGPSEDELRSRLEEELKKIKVQDVLLQSVVTLVNLGGQRLGLSEAGEDVRDLGQTRAAIDAVRALLPLLEAEVGGAEQMKPIRDALAQLQMAYAREVGGEAPGEEPAERPAGRETPTEPAGRQAPRKPGSSGRLWVPPGSTR